MGERLSIGAVAGRCGVTRGTIRYYERRRLLPKAARTPSGYREYGEGVLTRIALIRHAQQFGFSLAEIAVFLRVREAGGQPCHDVRRAGERLLQAIDRQIADLTATRDRMRRTLAGWDRQLAGTAEGERAYLLESVVAPERPHNPAKAGSRVPVRFARRGR